MMASGFFKRKFSFSVSKLHYKLWTSLYKVFDILEMEVRENHIIILNMEHAVALHIQRIMASQ